MKRLLLLTLFLSGCAHGPSDFEKGRVAGIAEAQDRIRCELNPGCRAYCQEHPKEGICQ